MYRKSISSLIFIIIFTATFSVALVPIDAQADNGVILYADLNEDANYNGGGTITPALPASHGAWPNIAESATDEVFFSFVAEGEFASDDTISLELPAGWSLDTACVSGNTTDIDGDITPDGAWTSIGLIATYTFSGSTTTSSSNGVEFCLTLTAPAVAPDQMDAVYLTASSVNSEFGAVLLYSGDENDVTVTASVETILRFEIRNTTDTGYTNACGLGLLGLNTVATCEYRLKVYSTASGGYTVKITSDGDLRTSGSGAVADGLDIDLVTEGAGAITNSSAEAYGIAVTAGSCSYSGGTAATELGNYTDDDSPMPVDGSTVEDLYDCAGVNSPISTDLTNTALIQHRAKIDDGTSSGTYTQTMTYYVTASF
ncbi:MAG TPA: hypothetical protein VMX18_03340 [Candidatus Bipolaricaulota bacterium]|nr:hypothetical protein [Candidatus Bipolaricaulota bacterium]